MKVWFFGKRYWKKLGCLKIMFTNKVFVPVCLKGKGILTLIFLSTGFSSCFPPCIHIIPSYVLPFSSPIPSTNRFHFSRHVTIPTTVSTLKPWRIQYLLPKRVYANQRSFLPSSGTICQLYSTAFYNYSGKISNKLGPAFSVYYCANLSVGTWYSCFRASWYNKRKWSTRSNCVE
jgi:hypothetical protein